MTHCVGYTSSFCNPCLELMLLIALRVWSEKRECFTYIRIITFLNMEELSKDKYHNIFLTSFYYAVKCNSLTKTRKLVFFVMPRNFNVLKVCSRLF